MRTTPFYPIFHLCLLFWLFLPISSATALTFAWDATALNSDNTPITDFSHYNLIAKNIANQQEQVFAVSNTTFTVTGLLPAVYDFQLSAVDLGGNESTRTAAIRVHLTDGSVTLQIMQPSATVYSQSPNVEYTLGDNNNISSAIDFELDGSLHSSDTSLNGTHVLNGVAAGGHTLLAILRDDNGVEIADTRSSITFTVDLSPPPAPTNLNAQVSPTAPTSAISLTWSDNSNSETGFRIDRKVGVGAFTTVTTAAKNTQSYADTALTPETTYSYRVCAVDAQGQTSCSSTVSATTEKPDPPPASPQNFRIL